MSSVPEFNPDEDVVVRICMTVAELPHPYITTSEKRECADCHAAVWFDANQTFAPGQEFGANPSLILCGECGVVRMMAEGATVMNIGDEPFEVKSLDDQLKELFDGH